MSGRRRRRGRPCGLTPRTEGLLLRAIRRGLPYKQAAALAGISYMSLVRWRQAGAKEAAPAEFRVFCDRLEKAEAEAADALLEIITKAGRERDWKAAAWILERRHPEQYASWNSTQIKGRDEEPLLPEAVITIAELKEEISPQQMNEIRKRSIARKKRLPKAEIPMLPESSRINGNV